MGRGVGKALDDFGQGFGPAFQQALQDNERKKQLAQQQKNADRQFDFAQQQAATAQSNRAEDVVAEGAREDQRIIELRRKEAEDARRFDLEEKGRQKSISIAEGSAKHKRITDFRNFFRDTVAKASAASRDRQRIGVMRDQVKAAEKSAEATAKHRSDVLAEGRLDRQQRASEAFSARAQNVIQARIAHENRMALQFHASTLEEKRGRADALEKHSKETMDLVLTKALSPKQARERMANFLRARDTTRREALGAFQGDPSGGNTEEVFIRAQKIAEDARARAIAQGKTPQEASDIGVAAISDAFLNRQKKPGSGSITKPTDDFDAEAAEILGDLSGGVGSIPIPPEGTTEIFEESVSAGLDSGGQVLMAESVKDGKENVRDIVDEMNTRSLDQGTLENLYDYLFKVNVKESDDLYAVGTSGAVYRIPKPSELKAAMVKRGISEKDADMAVAMAVADSEAPLSGPGASVLRSQLGGFGAFAKLATGGDERLERSMAQWMLKHHPNEEHMTAELAAEYLAGNSRSLWGVSAQRAPTGARHFGGLKGIRR